MDMEVKLCTFYTLAVSAGELVPTKLIGEESRLIQESVSRRHEWK
jgi:hypothetical protein